MREIEGREHMPDLLDRAQYIAANLNIDALAKVRREAAELEAKLGRPTGFCMSCGALTDDLLARFCDHDCSSDWQREQDAARRNFGET
jgi:hypothetical protein